MHAELLDEIDQHVDALGRRIGPRPVGSGAHDLAYDYLRATLERVHTTASDFTNEIVQQTPVNWACRDECGYVDVLPGASTPSARLADAPVESWLYTTRNDFSTHPPRVGSIIVARLGQLHESELCVIGHPAAAVAWFREGHSGLYSGNCKRPETQPLCAGFAVEEHVARRWIESDAPVSIDIEVEARNVTLRSIVCDVGPTASSMPCFVSHYDSKPLVAGANDNASGVAVLLAMLRHWSPEKSARFVLMDGEEIGVKGASAYAAHLDEMGELARLSAIVCPDAVGLGELHLYTADKFGPFEPDTVDRARAAFLRDQWIIPERAARSGSSDYLPFHERAKPCVFLSDHPNYVRHTSADTVEQVKIDVLARLARVLLTADF